MKKLTWIAAAGATLALTVVLGIGLMGGLRASAQGTVNFDIDPETTGNSANTLGTIEDCVEITVPSPSFDGVSDYVIDIIVTGDTQAPVAYDASLNYCDDPSGGVDPTKCDGDPVTMVHIAPPDTDTIIKLPGSMPLGDVVPDSDGVFAAGALYLFGGPGTAGNGTLVRVGLDIGASGVVTFSLNPPALTAYASGAGTHPVTLDSGQLAINASCAADADGDGVDDLADLCPGTAGGDPVDADGCSDAQVDADGDGICDPGAPSGGPSGCTGSDNCPNDPDKAEPGICGCGVPDTDSDGDGTPDCNDNCPTDPNKTEPGICGCGTPDTDSDSDGTPDCNDNCPTDPNKTEPGICGCGTPDTDSDGDGTPDCNDDCPADPNKTEPGICGCGTPDTDSDGDGTPDCNDGCPTDPDKTEPGICGCGVPDTDSDGDGTPDCNDNCPTDPNKTEPGICGCGTPDT
ncbi:MAG: thrombospondin type 3 repeat-containing protein, partial [Dehalococcoidia bacterium]